VEQGGAKGELLEIMNYDIFLLFYCTVRVIYFMILTDDLALVRVQSSSAPPSGTRRRKRRTSGNYEL
jgi:hypothetical protein